MKKKLAVILTVILLVAIMLTAYTTVANASDYSSQVDGLFDVKVGEAVDPTSIDEIAKALLMILNNREAYVDNTKINFDSYRWSTIADLYMSLYSDLIKK